MITRRDFVAGLGAMGLGSMVAAPALAQSGESTMARIQRTKVLRTGFVAGAAPYYVKSVATGEWKGFCVDFAKELAASLGVKLQAIDTTWGNAVLDLQANKIDCMFGMAPTEQRRKTIGFSDTLFENTFTLVARKGFDPKTWDDVNKPEVKLSVDTGSNQDNFATSTLKNATLRRFDTSGDATLALQTGRVDAQVLVALLGVTVLTKQPALGHLVVPTPFSAAPTSIGLQKETDTAFVTHVNAWLKKMRESGQVKKTILDNMQQLVGVDPSRFPKEVKL